MIKLVTYLILFTLNLNSYAYDCEVTQYIIPPAKKIEWSSEGSVIKSFLQSQTRATKVSRRDIQRKTVGHVVSRIKSKNITRWTSISIKPIKAFPSILINGVGGIFKPIRGALVQNQKAILRFIYKNRRNLNFMTASASMEICVALISMDDDLRDKAKHKELEFGPTLTDIQQGGTGASYAAYMLELIGVVAPYEDWKQVMQLKDGSKHQFYDSYNMWSYVNKLMPNKTKVQALKYKKRKFVVKGIELDSST